MIRPLHDWLVVQLDPFMSESSTIFIPTDSQRLRTGTVLRVGPGKWSKSGARIPVGIEAGEKVAFWRENLEHQQGKEILSTLQDLGEDSGMIRASDVLYVLGAD